MSAAYILYNTSRSGAAPVPRVNCPEPARHYDMSHPMYDHTPMPTGSVLHHNTSTFAAAESCGPAPCKRRD